MTFWLFSVLSALLIIGQSSAQNSNQKENTTLLLVQALLRHGDKAPDILYKNDSNGPDIWPEGLGKLTQYGKKQQYAVGKFLRSMYDGFLTNDPKEVCANSSEEDRCLRGVAVTLAGLYEPEGIWKFEDDLNWQPIPVYYMPADKDKYLITTRQCPQMTEEWKRCQNSEKMQELARKHQKMLEDVSNYVGMNVSHDSNSMYLYDTLQIEKTRHLAIAALLENYFEEIGAFQNEKFKCMFGSDLSIRLRFGSLLGEISENMKRKLNGAIPDLKFQLYSVHDVNVAAFLKVFGFTNIPRPPNCATLMVELHKMADATEAVRLLYLNWTGPLTDLGEPHVLVLDDCSEFCPLANFTRRFQHLIPADWEQECQLDEPTKYNTSIEILVSVFGMIVAICFLTLFVFQCNRRKKLKERDEKCLSNAAVNNEKNVT